MASTAVPRTRRAPACAGRVLLCALLVLTGCVRSSRSGAPESLRGAQLEVIGDWTGVEQRDFSQVLARFSAATGVIVHYTPANNGVAAAIDRRRAARAPVDVALLPQPGLLRRYAQAGALVALDAATRSAVAAHYSSVWQRLATVGGTPYGVWFKAANKSLVWYDVGQFERAGVVAPTTLAGLSDVARSLHRGGVTAFAVAGAERWTLTDWFENIYLRLAGTARYDALARNALRWTDESVVTTLGRLATLWDPGLMQRDPAATDLDSSVRLAFGHPSRAAMVMEGDFMASLIAADTTAAIGTDADVFAFPGETASDTAVVGGGDVAAQFSPSPAATALMRYLASPQAATVWVRLGGFVSPNLDVDMTAYPSDLARSIARSLIEAGDRFRFDLSDLAPPDFGSSPSAGLQLRLGQFLQNRDVASTVAALQHDADRAYAGTAAGPP